MQAQYGRLTVVSAPPGRYWLCQCACGSAERRVCKYKLMTGHSTSCGCRRAETIAEVMRAKTDLGTHRHARTGKVTAEYKTWVAMKRRCRPDGPKPYRLVSVCERWSGSFEAFLANMGPRPTGMSIDRIDNNGNYEPSNCRWATRKQQQRNQSTNVWVEFNGRRMTVAELAEMSGMNDKTLRYRLRLGWSAQKAATEPLDLSRRKAAHV